MNLWVRSWTAAVIAVLALTSIPEIYAVVHPSGVAVADVCASVGRRVSVSGCTNVADTVNTYVPPPAAYAPPAAPVHHRRRGHGHSHGNGYGWHRDHTIERY